jgi:hypothetical protein
MIISEGVYGDKVRNCFEKLQEKQICSIQWNYETFDFNGNMTNHNRSVHLTFSTLTIEKFCEKLPTRTILQNIF